MQLQTVFRAGNSDVVAIPKLLKEKYGITSGKKILIGDLPDVGIVIKKASKASTRTGDDKVGGEFQRWLKGAMKEDAQILDQLA